MKTTKTLNLSYHVRNTIRNGYLRLKIRIVKVRQVQHRCVFALFSFCIKRLEFFLGRALQNGRVRDQNHQKNIDSQAIICRIQKFVCPRLEKQKIKWTAPEIRGLSKIAKLAKKLNLRIIKKYAAIYPTVKIQVTAIATPPTTSSTPKIQLFKKMYEIYEK